MSLETANWIKDLVSSNPQGTDAKSQGDDHLRMLKGVLKQQFSGLSQGKAITVTEDQINSLISGVPVVFTDANALGAPSFLGVFNGSAGQGPAGAVVGDMMLHLYQATNSRVQIWFRYSNGQMLTRGFNAGAYTPWVNVTPIGVQQTWQNLTASRAFNTAYTNNSGRPITVSITGSGSVSAAAYMEPSVGGVMIGRAAVAELFGVGSFAGMLNNMTFIVPDGLSYQCGLSGTVTLVNWAELR